MANPGHPRPDELIARLAARQHGAVALWQLGDHGITRAMLHRRAVAGRLHRVHPGVYAVGYARLSRAGRWMAAVLAGGPGAALSHRAALALWELRPAPSGPVDVTVVARGRRGSAGIRVHCVRALDPRDITTRDGIPVTTVARTLLDYADRARPQALRLAIEAAERRDLLDGRALRSLLERSRGRHGTPRLLRALAAITGPAPWTQSEFENRFLALVRAAGLPEPQTNVLVQGELVDVYWPQARLVVELDGFGYHRGRSSFEDDRRRDAKLTLAGIAVMRLTDRRLNSEPAVVVAELLALITRRAA